MKSRKDIRKRLGEELARVNASIVAIKKEPRAQELEGFGDTTPLSEEIDAISSAEQKELETDRLGRLLDRAAALDEAMHRLHEGTYGRCTSCGAAIGKERLEAVPEAARCAACQSEVERRQTTEEPLPAEWRAARDLYAAREAFEDEDLERQATRFKDMSHLLDVSE